MITDSLLQHTKMTCKDNTHSFIENADVKLAHARHSLIAESATQALEDIEKAKEHINALVAHCNVEEIAESIYDLINSIEFYIENHRLGRALAVVRDIQKLLHQIRIHGEKDAK